MLRTCVVNLQTNLVENVIERGGEIPSNCKEDSAAPKGYAWVEHQTAGIGWLHVDGQLLAPPVSEPDRDDAIKAQLAAIDATCGMNRGLREFVLISLQMADILRATNPALPDLSANKGVQKVREAELAAIALRAKLSSFLQPK